MVDKVQIRKRFEDIQDQICSQLEAIDNSKFLEEKWERPGGGGGRTRILQGNIIEKGGVNFSAVEGELPDSICKLMGLDNCDFFATGVSIVMHPVNPWVPIIHMNIRYFETTDGKWWYGGGIDLTPHYINEEQAKFFHTSIKKICDKHNRDYYPDFKNWADEYFYIEHRKETRGIGGIFFDYLGRDTAENKENLLSFVADIGENFAPLYIELINRNKDKIYSEEQVKWQQIRRGRYVEFNLVYDRGTKFGLQTDGRVESILMSLPLLARWEYNYQPNPGSEEEKTLTLLKKGINWL